MTGTPMLDDIALRAVQHIRQESDQAFLTQRVAGLDGTLHQRLGRRSHRVELAGTLFGETAADDLKALQHKAQSGEEVTFAADITTALEISHVVIESFVAEQQAGELGRFAYELRLAENPPLPPPAEVSAFGGLDDFGVGDLGFEDVDSVLDGAADQAAAALDAADGALEAAAGLSELAGLGDFDSVGNPIQPLTDEIGSLADVGGAITAALGPLRELL